jgi:transcriptional regulator with XRE-family HTH domain
VHKPKIEGYEGRRVIGSQIKEWRERAGLTKAQLATLMDIVPTALSAIELGRTAIPPQRYAEVARILFVSPKTLGEMILRHYHPELWQMLRPKSSGL